MYQDHGSSNPSCEPQSCIAPQNSLLNQAMGNAAGMLDCIKVAREIKSKLFIPTPEKGGNTDGKPANPPTLETTIIDTHSYIAELMELLQFIDEKL